MTLKREIKDAYLEGGNSIYVKTHSNAVYVNENETETLTKRLDNVKSSIAEHTSQLNDITYYVTLEQFGAIGDGVTDDTDAFVEALATKKNIVLQEKTYLIDFNSYDFTGITITGTKSSVLLQNNANIELGKIGQKTTLKGFSIETVNNTKETAILVFGGETHLSYKFHNISDLNFTCDRFTTPIFFNLHKGSIGGIIKNINISTCFNGISIESYNNDDGHGWLTGQTIENVFIIHPYNYGFAFTPKTPDKLPQLSHCSFSNISVEIFEENTTAFKLGYGCYDIINPKVFNDNKTGDAYAIEFPNYLPKWCFVKSNITGGVIEGLIKNEQYSHCFNINNLMLVERNNFHTAPLISLGRDINKEVSLINGDYVKNTINNVEELITITKNNLTIKKGIDENGAFIELTNTDDSKQGKFKIELGKDFFTNINYHDYFTFLLKVNTVDTAWFLYDTGISTSTTSHIQQTYKNIGGNKVYQLAYYCDSEKDLDTAVARNIQITLIANRTAKIKIYYLDVLYGVYLPSNI